MGRSFNWDRVTREQIGRRGADFAFRREFYVKLRSFELKGPDRPCGLCEFDVVTGDAAVWWRKDQDLMAHAECAQRDWDRRRER